MSSTGARRLRLDLHVHTDRSDGKFPPEEVLRRAATNGIDVIALADHDLDPSLAFGPHEVDGHPIRLIAAAEVSGAHEGKELHLLVYFRGAPPPEATAFLRGRVSARARRFDEAATRLGLTQRADGSAHAGEHALTRFHLAQALAESGKVRRPSDAWPHLGLDVVPIIDFEFVNAIRMARSWNAVTSWAHPSLADANRFTKTFAAAGLEGLEGARPGLDRPTRNGLKRLAKEHKLLITGGSDWHGWWPGNLGDYRFEDENSLRFLERLDG